LFDLAAVLEGNLSKVSCTATGLDLTHGEHTFSFTMSNQICQSCLLQRDGRLQCPWFSRRYREERSELSIDDCAETQGPSQGDEEESPFTILFFSSSPPSPSSCSCSQRCPHLHYKHQDTHW